MILVSIETWLQITCYSSLLPNGFQVIYHPALVLNAEEVTLNFEAPQVCTCSFYVYHVYTDCDKSWYDWLHITLNIRVRTYHIKWRYSILIYNTIWGRYYDMVVVIRYGGSNNLLLHNIRRTYYTYVFICFPRFLMEYYFSFKNTICIYNT